MPRNTAVIFVAPFLTRAFADDSTGHVGEGGPLLYLLRVSVPDRPGALGVLASAIGAAGGDITAVDVVEREASSAIDDILIETPDAASAAAILSTVSALAGVVIETWQPYTEGDQLHDGLDIVNGLGSTSAPGARRDHPHRARRSSCSLGRRDRRCVRRRRHHARERRCPVGTMGGAALAAACFGPKHPR